MKFLNIISSNKVVQLKTIFWLLLVNSSGVLGYSLEDEINQLMIQNPEIIAERFKIKQAEAEEDAAYSNYSPVVSASGQTGFQSYKDTGRAISSDLHHYKYRFELTQNLFKGLRDQVATAGAAANISLKQWSALKLENDLIYKGIVSYLNVLQYHRMLLAINNKVDVLKRFISLKQKSQAAGSGTVIDIYQATFSLQKIEQQRLDINGKYRAAFRQYQMIFEHDPVIAEMSVPNTQLIKALESLEQALERAKSTNAELAMSERQIEIAEQEKKAVLGKYSPELDVVAAYERETNFQGIKGAKTDSSVFVRLTWDFNLANQLGDQYRSAAEKVHSQKYSFQATEQDVEEKIKLAWERKQLFQQQLEVSQNTLKIAKDIYQAREKQNNKGSGNEIDLLNAKSQLLGAKIALINVTFEALKSSYDLLHAVGLLHVEYKSV